MTSYTVAENLAAFLMANKGSVLAVWSGKMTATDQRKLMGQYIGKGTIVVDGTREYVCNRVKVCFGHDYDDRNVKAWKDL